MRRSKIALSARPQDYDEKLVAMESNIGGTNVSWRQLVQPYIKSTQVFSCPSNTENAKNANDAYLTFPAVPRSYAISYHYVGPGTGIGNAESVIQSPSTKILAGENKTSENGLAAGDWDTTNGFPDTGFAGHLSTANYLFGDGHVKALKPTKTITPVNMWGAFVDNTDSIAGCAAPGWDRDDARTPNCDEPSNGALAKLQALEAKYK